MKRLILTGSVLSSILLSSCASIVSKSSTNVNIQGTPGADVIVKDRKNNTVFQGVIPCTVNLKNAAGYFQKGIYTFDVSKGTEKQTQTITASMNPWYAGNLCFGHFLGFFLIDPLTGAMYKIEQQYINFNFKANSYNDLPQDIKEKAVFIGYVAK
jgi:hypothetical protein